MNIAIITSIKTPYRSKQIESICMKNPNFNITVFYTADENEGRNWEEIRGELFSEQILSGYKLSRRYGYLNKGLRKIIKENDVIFIGGYEKPSYILLAILTKIYRKKYVLIFDGISTHKLTLNKCSLKYLIKKFVIHNSAYIWGNGEVSKRYFINNFNYNESKIYNQFLTIDSEIILGLSKTKEEIRKKLREKYNIPLNAIVLHFSGRLIKIKNVEFVIEALSKVKNKDIFFLITGDGVEKEKLIMLAKDKNVKVVVTGFINRQEELFKHYYMSDIFILPSIEEPWGLVVNEAMYAKLPLLISERCGCHLDLLKENGYIFNPLNNDDLVEKINDLIEKEDFNCLGQKSFEIIKIWNFDNSANEFEKIINNCFKL